MKLGSTNGWLDGRISCQTHLNSISLNSNLHIDIGLHSNLLEYVIPPTPGSLSLTSRLFHLYHSLPGTVLHSSLSS